MTSHKLILRSTWSTILGGLFLIVAAFCVDYRLGWLAISLLFFWDSHISVQQAVAMKIEEHKNK